MIMEDNKRSPKEFAKNYPQVLHDSPLIGPITVGNVNKFTKDGEEKTIINLNLRTEKSGDKNAVISFPSDWRKASQFKRGDLVNVQIDGGYVKRIWPAKAESIYSHKVSAATVDAEIKQELDTKSAEEAMDSALHELEVKKQIQQESELAQVGGGTDDLPF